MKKGNKVIDFILRVAFKAQKDDLVALSGQLTYKLLLAIFPFLIFAISIIGFLNLDGNYLLEEIHGVIPEDIYDIVAVFIDEVVNQKSLGILSSGLIVSIVSASTGFKAIIKGVNKAYGQTEDRSFIKIRGISLILTFIFTLILASIIVLFIFRDALARIIFKYVPNSPILNVIFGFSGYLIAVFILLVAITIIYKFASSKKVSIEEILPGSFSTLIIWIIAGKLFNIYINNFAKFSKVYGSIASIFILMFWLNIMCAALLVGSEINAVIQEIKDKEGYKEKEFKIFHKKRNT